MSVDANPIFVVEPNPDLIELINLNIKPEPELHKKIKVYRLIKRNI